MPGDNMTPPDPTACSGTCHTDPESGEFVLDNACPTHG